MQRPLPLQIAPELDTGQPVTVRVCVKFGRDKHATTLQVVPIHAYEALSRGSLQHSTVPAPSASYQEHTALQLHTVHCHTLGSSNRKHKTQNTHPPKRVNTRWTKPRTHTQVPTLPRHITSSKPDSGHVIDMHVWGGSHAISRG